VFQVNLSRGWQAEFAAPVPAASLLAQLMQHNPAPFSALLQLDDWAIVSSSTRPSWLKPLRGSPRGSRRQRRERRR